MEKETPKINVKYKVKDDFNEVYEAWVKDTSHCVNEPNTIYLTIDICEFFSNFI